MQAKTIRRCKVHGRGQEISHLYPDGRSGYRAVPWLRLGGLWLERSGFKVGDPLEVTVSKGRLMIKKVSGHGNR